MADSLSQEIEERLRRYLRAEESLTDFEAWIVPATWDISPQSDRAAHDLATAITLRVAEFTNGDCTEDELRDALENLPPAVGEQITLSGVVKGQGTMRSLGQGSFSVVGKPHSKAFA